jgi:hypothetical protein
VESHFLTESPAQTYKRTCVVLVTTRGDHLTGKRR